MLAILPLISALAVLAQAQSQCPDFAVYSQASTAFSRTAGIQRSIAHARSLADASGQSVNGTAAAAIHAPESGLSNVQQHGGRESGDGYESTYQGSRFGAAVREHVSQYAGHDCEVLQCGGCVPEIVKIAYEDGFQTENLAFIITGDITASDRAQWLRDTANQFAAYSSLISLDPSLAVLMKAVINNEARYVSQYPYCGSFQPPPESGLAPSLNGHAVLVEVNPPVNNQTVFECKYEIDSLCGFLKLSRSYYSETKDVSFMDSKWFDAIDQILTVVDHQSQASFDADFNWISYYNFTGLDGSLEPAVANGGNGEPKGYTGKTLGMVGTHHRPSDDLSTYAFLTPANAMLSVELGNLVTILTESGKSKTSRGKNVTALAKTWSKRVHDAIWNSTVVNNIFAYETNGLGSRYVMDDANVPSLLSLPYLGFLDMHNPTYVATRKLLLSRMNPYFAAGKNFSGIGGPHVDAWNPWPMSQITAIFGTDDDKEILDRLSLIAKAQHGRTRPDTRVAEHLQFHLVHSPVVRLGANSYFGEMMLDLAKRKPGLIFHNSTAYTPGH
ncbi:unnamed protein product [Mycena citricolor]|uniref:Alpha,alpha-trehalase n=1 Tax=Mycena citricolor TaxID=2018698 RepID=A0AAD2H6E0_9AGAR|nr:unnamed protein product [Mycena citricolor]